MDLIRYSIIRPIAVVAAVLMIVMFGLVALQTIPIQLIPDVRKPVISVTTNWPGAAPAEIEREILIEQEDVLKGIEGLSEITSTASTNQARIKMEFEIGTNMDRALLLTANRLDRVSGYPEEVDEPSIRTATAEDNAISWMIIRRNEGNANPIHSYGDFVEDVVQDRLERVPGIARINTFGGSSREMVVTINPERMARFGLTVTDVVARLRQANSSASAGDVDEGKRRYAVRTEGEFQDLDDVRGVVVRSVRDSVTGQVARVTIADIGDVVWGYSEPGSLIRFNGVPALAMNAIRESGANVIEAMTGLRAAIEELNEQEIPGQNLNFKMVYDETTYINSAIDLVQQNIVVGGLLAAAMLLLFLRSGGATLIVSLAIPVSVIGAFVAMAGLGRSLNVISLAGIAFAVGMVVDAAIVVLENIYRHRELGLGRAEAAYRGAKQVWVAVLVSALTTVMVFIPVLVIDLEAGQLFRDIAVALSISVLISLAVAITLIPALANRLLKTVDSETVKNRRIPIVDDLAGMFVLLVMGLTRWVTGGRARAIAVVTLLCTVCATLTWALLPKLEYLPTGNRNLIFGWIVPPPGYNLQTTEQIARRYEERLIPLIAEYTGPESAEDGTPKFNRVFFVTWPGRTILGGAAEDPSQVKKLIPVIKETAAREPGTFSSVSQSSLFGRGIGGSRGIELNVIGQDLEVLIESARRAFGKIRQALPPSEGHQARPLTELSLGAPEVRVIPNRIKLADNGVTARQLSDTLDAFNDGLRVAEITMGGRQIDLTLKGDAGQVTETQGIGNLPVVTSNGAVIPASSLADVVLTAGPTQIKHFERERAITILIIPREEIPLEAALDQVQTKVIDALIEEGLPDDIKLRLSGTADQLQKTWDALRLDLGIALIIVYLVMAVLFESFRYPLIIMLSVPLATAGGVLGLTLLNQFHHQSLDMLTLLGFVILIGIVVNNAILLVHQTLLHIREDGMEMSIAIQEATRNRIRPIFMSTLTSVFGMTPLVIFPGAGSELYRGLGSVVLGGLSMSAILTLVIIPPLLTLSIGTDEKKQKHSGSDIPDIRQPAE